MPINRWIITALLSSFFILTGGTVTIAGEISPRLQTAIRDAAKDEYIPVIIQLSQQVDRTAFKSRNRSLRKALRRSAFIKKLKANATSTQRDLITLLKARKGKSLKSLWMINGVATKLPARAIERVARHPAVSHIKLDRVVPLAVGVGNNSSPPEWNISAVHADDLWGLGYDGQGVVVALMDTGVDLDHPDLTASYRGGSNSWYDPNGEHTTPHDSDGHGTSVLSVIVGADADGTNIGVAPGAQWIAVKIFDGQGEATFSAIHAGFQWLMDPDGDPNTDDAPHIVNNSWGLDIQAGTCDLEFSNDIEALITADIAVVFSAGNSGPLGNTSVAPANDPLSFATGSVADDLSVESQSARGPSACDGDYYPNLVAPGVNIKAADLTLGGLFPDSYRYLSGTSLAAPHMAGAMALLLSAFPDLTVIELEDALTQSAIDLGPAGPDDDYGHGMVDALAAFNLLDSTPTCTDDDGDGFYAETGCGTASDCNDSDPTIYPGATEIKFDGIDQDCNGYDLTIDTWRAIYYVDQDKVSIRANSDLGAAANLSVDIPGIGVRPMDWNTNKQWWQRTTNNVTNKGFDPYNPGNVVILGIEGMDSVPITIDGVIPPICTDADGDGFFAEAGCGTAQDCNDSDPVIYPGATEIQFDGIDQDCNGYDLTIDIWKAIYYVAQDKLSIRANSDLGAAADLSMDIPGIGVKSMDWNATKQWWQRTINNAISKGFDPNNPGSVIISGIEGSENRAIVSR